MMSTRKNYSSRGCVGLVAHRVLLDTGDGNDDEGNEMRGRYGGDFGEAESGAIS